MPDTIAIKLTKLGERALRSGHPWIFEKSIAKQNRKGSSGDIVIIFDQKRNKFLGLGLFDANSVIRIKVLQFGSPVDFNFDYLHNKISSAYKIRRPLEKSETNAFRVVYGENDGLPGLIIDRYAHILVIKLYSAVWIPYLKWVIESLQTIWKDTSVLLRLSRILQKELRGEMEDGTWLIKPTDPEVIFMEYGIKFKSNVLKGHKTGFFLDQRHNRNKIRKLARDKKVLDVFSYNGGFSVNALVGGASNVTSVDISKQALDLALENAKLNQNNPNIQTICGDAFLLLEEMVVQGKKYDLIVIDPPSLAKKSEEMQKALKMYQKLCRSGLKLLNTNGILLMASCSSRIQENEFYMLVENECSRIKGSFKILERTEHDIDHPKGISELNYLKGVYIRKVG